MGGEVGERGDGWDGRREKDRERCRKNETRKKKDDGMVRMKGEERGRREGERGRGWEREEGVKCRRVRGGRK